MRFLQISFPRFSITAPRSAATLSILALLLIACQPQEVTELNQTELPVADAPEAKDTMGRLISTGAVTQASNGPRVSLRLNYIPEGWQRIPARNQFYLFSFELPGEVRCDVALSGGNLNNNLARWVNQFPDADPNQYQLAQLEDTQLAGLDGKYISIQGRYEPGMGRATQPEVMLLGAIASDGQGSVITVKLTGKIEAVKTQQQAFRAFCQGVAPSN